MLIGVSREHGNFLERLRQRGVAVALDDFGTGYSSLQYLRRLPVDRLKIAQEFVQGMATDQGHRTITRTIVRLARGLGLEVVAEGVETPEQLAVLHRWGCHEVQGYLFARPMPGEAMAAFLATGLPDFLTPVS